MSNSGPFALIAVVVVVAILGAKSGQKNGIPCKCQTGKGRWQPGRLRTSDAGPVWVSDRSGPKSEPVPLPGTNHLDVRDLADNEKSGVDPKSRVFAWTTGTVKLAVLPNQEQAVRDLLAAKPGPLQA